MLKPLKSKLILQLIEKQKVTSSGIILSSADPAEANRGLVLAVGPDVTEVTVGEMVLPNWNKANKIKGDDGEDNYILEEDDIILVFEDQ
jgi:co-chaperonin GroES (HSP10)